MGKMGGSRHLKRLAAPGYYPVAKREKVWVVKPRPGPHPIDEGIPLLLIVRDVLKLATTTREARKIISMKKIYVDGKPRYDYKFQVGLMDVISIPEVDSHYRVIPDPHRFLKLLEIPPTESKLKVVKVVGKRTVRGGRMQLSSHDNRNFLFDDGIGREVKPGDSLLIELPSQEIKEVLKLQEGSLVLVTRGRMAGHLGTIKELGEVVEISDIDNPELTYRGVPRNVMVVGRETPKVKVR
ncbi:MAG: 30S ribosomal protein S4e [Candidatus Korarchaeum sp.]|nr:30S ribosomal protein S4e [Candidatus Korarchaeum sp.]MDW8035451.1 30S ribosomal protein S4e [Candidatus Korarchaeum sp.]